MKRYMVRNGYTVPLAIEDPKGEIVRYIDLQSHARTLLAVVERMEHFTLCDTWNPGINDGCTCPLGELRRGLEVML